MSEWNEEDHPRDEGGKFTDAGGGSGVKVYRTLYHQTKADSLADFSEEHRGAGVADIDVPAGIFLKDTDEDIGLAGKNQLALEVTLDNALEVKDREELTSLLDKNNEIRSMRHEAQNYDQITADTMNKMAETAETDADFDKIDTYYESRKKEEAILSNQIQQASQQYLKSLGYDGVVIEHDEGAFGRSVKSTIVFDLKNLKEVEEEKVTKSKKMLEHIRFGIRTKLKAEQRTENEQKKHIIKGYALLFDTPAKIYTEKGEATETISKDALKDTNLDDRIYLLHQHKWDEPLGVTGKNLKLKVDEGIGLYVECELGNEPIDRYVFNRVKDNLLDSMSFGGYMEFDDDQNGNRTYTKCLELEEVSIVTRPQFYEASVIVASKKEVKMAELDDEISLAEAKAEARDIITEAETKEELVEELQQLLDEIEEDLE